MDYARWSSSTVPGQNHEFGEEMSSPERKVDIAPVKGIRELNGE